MKLSPWRKIGSLAALLLFVSPLWPQAASPHVGFVFPAGGRQGSTVEVKLGGHYLDGAASVQISGAGVQAEVLSQTKPLTLREIDTLRNRLQDLQKKSPKSDTD